MSTSFGNAVDAYDSARPGYPPEAVDWLLASRPARILDLGAGTGKLTASPADRGAAVTAVDPDERMLQRLSEKLPEVDARVGTGEAIPLPDASVDAVVAGQAWHWVDPDRALPEAVRVLRPGGTLGLVWNVRDESVPWVAALGQAMGESVAEATFDSIRKTASPLGAVEEAVFDWSLPLDRDGIRTLVSSRSAFIDADAAERAAVLARVDAVLDTHPDLRGVTRYELPYRTHAFRASLPGLAYDHALRGARRGWWRGAVAIVAFLVLFFGVNTVLGGIAIGIEALRGEVDLEQVAEGRLPITPLVLLATNLSLAASIPIAWLLQWGLFGVRPRWLSSVVGGFRWRWMLRLAIVIVPVWLAYVSLSFVGGGTFAVDGTVVAAIVVVVLTTPLQAAGEEYGLRGLVQRSAGSWFANPRTAFVGSTAISAVIFGALHFATDPWLIGYYILFGVAMSVAAHFTGGLEAPVLIHTVNNVLLFLAAALLGQLDAGIDRSAGAGGPFVLIPAVLVSAAAGFAAWRAHRRGVVTRAAPPPAP